MARKPATTPKQTNLADAHTQQPSLRGRRAIVTGGTTGIGRAIAVLLAAEGASVFVCGRTSQHLKDALGRIREVGEGDGMTIDLAEPGQVDVLFETAEKALGGIDIVVVNAAIPGSAVGELSEQELAYQVATDFTAYLESTRQALARMKKGSDIILIGSMSGVSQAPGGSVYAGMKAGVHGFGRSLREEVSGRDIKVGVIEPGLTGADFHYPEIPAEKQVELINQDRMLRAEDIAAATHFMLCQPRRSAVSLIRVESRLKPED